MGNQTKSNSKLDRDRQLPLSIGTRANARFVRTRSTKRLRRPSWPGRAPTALPLSTAFIRVPLERIIERARDPALQVTGATVVQAIAVYGKLNPQGQLIERRETLNLNELFERMTVQEKEAYARDGKLPEWFTQTVGNQVVTGPNENEAGADAG